MNRRPSFLLAPLLGAALVLGVGAGCDSGKTQMDFRHNKERKGTPVATFGNDSITAEELQQRLSEMNPYARARYQTVEQKKEYLEGLLRFEMLAQEALDRGLQNDPDVVETAKKVMVQKLVQKELDERSGQVSDAELAAYYEKHKADYVRAEMIRLSHVFLAAPASNAELRAKKRQEAGAILAQAQALQPMDFAAFGKLARDKSEEPRTQALDGDLRYLSEDELKTQYGPEVAKAALALGKVGDLSGVVETGSGFHVLKLQGKQAPLNLSLADVKAQLQSRVLYEKRMQGHEHFLDELKKKHQVKIDEAALAKVKVDLQAPAQQPKAGAPGFLPPPASAPPSPTVAAPSSAPGATRAAQ